MLFQSRNFRLMAADILRRYNYNRKGQPVDAQGAPTGNTQ